ncbi:MAG: hypothetical protein ACI9UO_001157, partial [Nitrospinales bacterium]
FQIMLNGPCPYCKDKDLKIQPGIIRKIKAIS